MSKPAARQGDTTVHGGTIVVGAPTVLIGGMPAARVGDQHLCPMLNPGSPGPPHVGGPISLGSPTVLICGQMAARVGDMAICQGPPDTIAAGCPTVLIGEMSSGGGGAGGAGSGGGAVTEGHGDAQAKSRAKGTGSRPPAVGSGAPALVPIPPTHFLKVKFVDKIGNPIRGSYYALKDPDGKWSGGHFNGIVHRPNVKAGNYEFLFPAIVSIGWSKDRGKPGEEFQMTAKVTGLPAGTKAEIEVWEHSSGRPRKTVARLKNLKLKGGKVTAKWKHEDTGTADEVGPPDPKARYETPGFYFTVKIGRRRATSGMLTLLDTLKIELKDDRGEAVADEKYLLYLPSGEVRKGQVDGSGKAEEKDVPIRGARLFFPGIPGARPLPRK